MTTPYPEELVAMAFERERVLKAENEHLKAREQHFARILKVTDGGRYRNDWDDKLTGVLAALELIAEGHPDPKALANLALHSPHGIGKPKGKS